MPTPRSSTLLAACLIALGALAACESSPNTSGSGATTTTRGSTQSGIDPNSPTGGAVTNAHGFRIDHDDWYRLGYRWDWSGMPYVSRRGRVTLVEPADDRLLIQDSGGFISVLDASSGRLVWNAQFGSSYTKFVGLQRDGDIILCSSAAELYEIGLETGNLLSRSSFNFLVDTPPTLVGNLAVYGSASGKLLAHNRTIGLIGWAYSLDGPVRTPPVLVNNSSLAAVSHGGDVVFFRPGSGSSFGRARIAGGVAHQPPTDGDRLYVPSLDQSVYAFDASDASLAWRVRTEYPITLPSVEHNGSLIVPLRAHGLTALNTGDGTLVWRNDELSGYVVAARDDELLVWDGESLAAVDAERGDIIFRAKIPGAAMLIADEFEDGALYVVARSGGIIRFRPRQ